MDEALQPHQDAVLTSLLEEEGWLEAAANDMDRRLSGLRDIDRILQLASARVRVATHLLDAIQPGATEESARQRAGMARDRAGAALRALEDLRAANVSQEQKAEVFQGPAYAELKGLLQEFLVRGGGALLQAPEADERRLTAVAGAVAAALRKMGTSDADYAALFRTERLPRFLRILVNTLLPELAPEHQQAPPFGIAPGQETVQKAEKMKMPLSQAIHYLQEELLPQLERELAARPGDPALLRQLRLSQERLREYRGIKMTPRATPINLGQGFYTDWLTQYTTDGELLVSINLPVQFGSGNNLQRLRELMQQEVVRRLAGRGISERLDAEYRFRRSLASGRRGSSRVPSQKLDFAECYRELRGQYPALGRLEDDRELRRVLDTVTGSGRREAARVVKALLVRQDGDFIALP